MGRRKRPKEALKDRIALLVGYTNGSLCYIPPLEAFPYGGYGVDFFPPNEREPAKFSRTILPKGAGEKMLDALLELHKQ